MQTWIYEENKRSYSLNLYKTTKKSDKIDNRGDSCEPDSLEYWTFCPKYKKKAVKFLKKKEKNGKYV